MRAGKLLLASRGIDRTREALAGAMIEAEMMVKVSGYIDALCKQPEQTQKPRSRIRG